MDCTDTKTIKTSNRAHRIIEEELRILARVTAVLSELSAGSVGAPDFDADLINLRDQIAEARPEDIPALVDQMMRISAIAQRYGKGRDLPANPESPYFAHLRLEEGKQTRDVLIGKRGFIDRGKRVQIVDWRNAPVSRIYYRYEEGDDYEERFGDHLIEGLIRARRSVSIQEARLRRIACPQGIFVSDEEDTWHEARHAAPSVLGGGQGSAVRVPFLRRGSRLSMLGSGKDAALRVDKHLPEIAALIDPVQFDLITRPQSGLVVLQGGAGSGKTTVALHRVAYLSYTAPRRFRADRMQVVVLTDAMVRYVEHVLPSLGVRGIPVRTARRWLSSMRHRVVPRAPQRYAEDTPAVVLHFKKHPLLLELLSEQVRRQMEEMTGLLGQAVALTPQGEEVMRGWEALAHLVPTERCAAFRRWLSDERNLSRLTVQQAQAASRRMARRLRDVLADWEEVFTDRAFLARGVDRLAPGEFSRADLERICSWCAGQMEGGASPSPPAGGNATPALPAAVSPDPHDPYISLDGLDERPEARSGSLDEPDDSLLLYLTQLTSGVLRPPRGKPLRYEHLVVDEAQDLSTMEIKVLLGCATGARSVTLAGDVAQRTVFDNCFSDWESLLGRINEPGAESRTLKVGYRSTEPIMELARGLVEGHVPCAAVQPSRSGPAVELHRFEDQGEAVGLLAEALRSLALREPLASVALIARFPEQARAYAQALTRSEVPGVRLVAQQEFSFRAGIEVTDVGQVKGLEFDYVILLDVTPANYPDTTESRHLLHIAATRAAHQLWIVTIGAPSPILTMAL